MKENWKQIPGFNKCYFVSDFGNFKSIARKEQSSNRICIRKDRVLKSIPQTDGYLHVGLVVNGKQKHFLSHRLVALSFIPNPENKKYVNHINGIKTDNRTVNLEWVTPGENLKHAFKIGLQCNKGENHPQCKLTDKIILEIRKKYIPRVYSTYKLAKEYSLSVTHVKDIVNNKVWSHL